MSGTSTLASMPQLSVKQFNRFSEFITREVGIRMPPGKMPLLQSRLQRRLRQLGLDSLERYQDFLFQSPDSSGEWIEFINLVTTNKTDFFRESSHFDFLVKQIIPEFVQGNHGLFKAWSAGCSSGEEPYTLAMVLGEQARLHSGFDFSILGTDISTRVLDHARNGIYEEERVDPVPLHLRKQYLLKSKNRENALVRISPDLRQKVHFGRLNLMDAHYALKDRYDLVLFRNVMIYFDKPVQQQVLTKICNQIHRGGYLFCGHSESLVGLDLPIKQISTAIFRKL